MSRAFNTIAAPLVTLAAITLPLVVNDDPAMAAFGGALSVITFYELGKRWWHKTRRDLSGNTPSGPA